MLAGPRRGPLPVPRPAVHGLPPRDRRWLSTKGSRDLAIRANPVTVAFDHGTDEPAIDGWLRIELRHLAALRAVAEEGAFGAAATKLGYTQSAVSQQIATLERAVGERLIDRPGGPRRVSLTEAGEVLLGHAERVVAGMEAAWADLQALAAGDAGTLRVGTYQSVGARILPELMRRFVALRPGVEVHLTESTSDQELLDLVERGEADLSFTVLPLADGPFEAVELMRDPYVVIVGADSDLADARRPAHPGGAGRAVDHRQPALLRRRAGRALPPEPGGDAERRFPLRRQRHRPGPGGRGHGGGPDAGAGGRSQRRPDRGAVGAGGAAAAEDRPGLAQAPGALARRAHVHRVRDRPLRLARRRGV